ncbi:MAG: hypothetical protein HQK54_17130 [Oligoflexales bacterium]|nr:hypothetical protein [Oligoflexales bacterium]
MSKYCANKISWIKMNPCFVIFGFVLFFAGCTSRNDDIGPVTYTPPKEKNESTVQSTEDENAEDSSAKTKKPVKRILVEDNNEPIEYENMEQNNIPASGSSQKTDSGSDAKAGDASKGTATDAPKDPASVLPAASGPDPIAVKGTIVRRVRVQSGDGGDGRGTICIFMLNFCPNLNNLQNLQLFGLPRQIMNADLSADGGSVPFEIPITDNIASGTYVIAASLLENGRECGRVFMKGDLMSWDSNTACPRFNYDQRSVSNLVVTLNENVRMTVGN